MRIIRMFKTHGNPVVFAFAALLLFAGGCSEGVEQKPLPREDSKLQRVVCGSPAVTEIVFALGCGDRVVGVSDYTVYPPEAQTKESIGGWANPNRERLLVLKPDIIISQGKHETLAAFAGEYGILVHSVKLDNLADIYESITSIADTLGVPERGTNLSNNIRQSIQTVAGKIPAGPPKRVFLLLGRTPGSLAGLTTVGPGTFLNDILNIAGGTNVFSDVLGAYPRISKESLLVRAPEIILEIKPGGMNDKTIENLRADWQALADIPAVRNRHLYYLTNNYLLVPGPRVALIAGDLAAAIHREIADE